MTTAVAVVFALLMFVVLLQPRVRNAPVWSATVTPLASIIGSGFLVSVPLLTHTVGKWAMPAMLGLMLLAYAVGAVLRYNIRTVESLIAASSDKHRASWLASAEHLSLLTLAFAYVISVSYYLTLLSAFLLNGVGLSDPQLARALTTALLVLITGIGAWRGLRGLEKVEIYAVSLNLVIIAGLLAALALYLLVEGSGDRVYESPELSWRALPIVLGLLIVVQGFETSKFLGSEYDAALRIRTMRYAQWISGAVYLVFFALVTPLMPLLGQTNEVTAIINLVAHVALVLPLIVTIGAMASQFSASIADSIGAGGLLHEASARRIAIRHTYPLIGLVGIVVVWGTNVVELITLASRAFALFYASQCVVGFLAAWQQKTANNRVLRLVAFALVSVFCFGVVLFGAPVDA